MSTPRQLQQAGVKHIKRACWTEGRVYLDDDFWAFIHPTDVPARHPVPVGIHMLPGDDWVEVTDKVKKVTKGSVHYRLATGSKRCGNCAMLKGQVCDLVLGRIERMYLCDRWVKK